MLGMVLCAYNPRTGAVRQEDYCEFRTGLEYVLSARLVLQSKTLSLEKEKLLVQD